MSIVYLKNITSILHLHYYEKRTQMVNCCKQGIKM